MTATGTSPATATKNSTVVQPQVSTSRQPRASRTAISAVHSQAFGCSIASTRSRSVWGERTSPNGLPAPSAAVNATESSAAANQTHAAMPAVRTAAYPSGPSVPDFCGGTRNAASSSAPMQTTDAASESTRTTVMP